MFGSIKLKNKDGIVDISGKSYKNFSTLNNHAKLALHTGIDEDTISVYDEWFLLDDGFYYFKVEHIIEELFLSELAHECDVRCVDFNFAFNNGSLGIISKLYRDPSKEYNSYDDFCKKHFNCIVDDLGSFKVVCDVMLGNDVSNRLMNDIYGLISFDIFTGQIDRYSYNVFFETFGNDIRLAPMCDNGGAFSLKNDYDSCFDMLSLHDGRKNGDSFIVFTEDSVYKRQLLGLLKEEKIFLKRFERLLDVNIDDALKRTLEKHGLLLSSYRRQKIMDYFDNKKRAVECTLSLTK